MQSTCPIDTRHVRIVVWVSSSLLPWRSGWNRLGVESCRQDGDEHALAQDSWSHRQRHPLGGGLGRGADLTLGFGTLVGAFPIEAAVQAVLPLTAQAGALGFASGVTFSAVFGAINRRRVLSEVGGFSTALLGGGVGAASATVIQAYLILSGIAVPPVALILNLLIGGALGTSVATGSLRIAQSGSPSWLRHPVARSPSRPAVSCLVLEVREGLPFG